MNKFEQVTRPDVGGGLRVTPGLMSRGKGVGDTPAVQRGEVDACDGYPPP